MIANIKTKKKKNKRRSLIIIQLTAIFFYLLPRNVSIIICVDFIVVWVEIEKIFFYYTITSFKWCYKYKKIDDLLHS